uniref:Uncharacterized protein n=1 Tax=Arundo donax TaxID=35708 RepID=A0A0A9FAI2_ARUDO
MHKHSFFLAIAFYINWLLVFFS